MLDSEVEIERISREMSTNIQQDQIVELGSPQKPRSREILGDMHLDAVTLQDACAHVAGKLVKIDEENFLVIENREATKWWWLVHPVHPRLARVLR